MKDIINKERPREKLINNGSNTLSDSELLAIMLSSGSKNESVLDLSTRLINEYGLERLFKMSYYELQKISGIKAAKATKLMATFEIARRIQNQNKALTTLNNSNAVYEYVKADYLFLDTEVVTIIYVNKLCQIIAKRSFSNNGVSKVIIPFREIVNEAIILKCFGIFMVHNHPSGDLKPSKDDLITTKNLINILKPLDIHLFDHLIISNNKFISLGDLDI